MVSKFLMWATVEFGGSRKCSDDKGEGSCGSAETCSAHSVVEMAVENPSRVVS